MGWTSCNMKQKIEACRLYLKIQGTAENRIVSKVFHWSSIYGKSWEIRFKTVLCKHELQDLLNKDCSVKEKVNFPKDKLKIIDINVWKNQLWNDSDEENGNKPYVKINMDRTHRRILAKFRSGSLTLRLVDMLTLWCR